MSKIKIGQIGVCHEHAAGKMRSLRLRPDLFEIVGIVDDHGLTHLHRTEPDVLPDNVADAWKTEPVEELPSHERMVAAAGNRVEALHREALGGLSLPRDLKAGEWRWLAAVDLEKLGILR